MEQINWFIYLGFTSGIIIEAINEMNNSVCGIGLIIFCLIMLLYLKLEERAWNK